MSDELLVRAATAVSLVVTLALAWRARRFLARGARAPGTVVRISVKESESGGSYGEQPSTVYTYTPHVAFSLKDGSRVEFASRGTWIKTNLTPASAQPNFSPGQAVTVVYDPARPAESAEIGGITVWRPTIYSGCLSVVLLLVSLWMLVGEERRAAVAHHRLTAPLLGGAALLLALRSVLRRIPRSAMRVFFYALAAAGELYGFAGYFAQGLAQAGALSFVKAATEWPVKSAPQVARDARGRLLLPVVAAGRVQIYDPAGRFEGGFFVDASGGEFRTRPADDGHIEVFTARGEERLVYDESGALHSRHADDGGGFGSLDRQGGGRSFPLSWYLWPLADPAAAWGAGLVGVVLTGFLGRRLTPRPQGSAASP